ncbi:MAG: XkdQ [Anaeromicrobium sp.]|jgi:hypothetical protein|uniref:XkdQ/YqbQ family protein n=1 Tax=Anaeromicrobium sp. TaxID=1929132 RepID=UPI0025D59B6C|nr:XkdQ [Anaeromicrobium sp.]MCT4593188.1 XkdQ [Anaeromicrobium sp.]
MAILIFKDKYKIDNLNEGIQLSEAIDTIAYTATIQLTITDELDKIGIDKGDAIEILETNFETKELESVFKGIIWEKDTDRRIRKAGRIICKERTVYLEESEDEYLFPAGQPATQRAKKLCSDWGIPIGSFENTIIPLSKAVYRSESIYGIMLKDLQETAQKGGELYIYQMKGNLDLIKVGSNKKVWDISNIIEEVNQKSSLDGTVTQVKVLGKEEKDIKTPVIGIYKKDADKYGTVQKIIQDEKIKSAADAKSRANNMFSPGTGSITTTGIDINSIRAGDKVKLNGFEIFVSEVTHKLGNPGRMSLTLENYDQIRRRFYNGNI